MNTAPSTPENDANLSGLGRALLETGGSKPASGPWVPPTAEELGKLLPDYEIVKMLGRGGMGAVYMGRQKSLDRPVAIKILSTVLEDADSSFAERFKNEARAMGKLNHPGIVGVYDFGETADGLLYIVMEFVEGTDVAKMIAKEGRLHTEHAMAITAHVCDALGYAHERGIIHRDIKPANIMVGYDGVVKVADFGLAKMTHSQNTGLTQSGMAMGTLHYMAPEALMLGTAVDHRADIYAVGVMLYQMLTGKIPQGMFKLPSLQIPGLDPRYDQIIAKAIMEDREARYQTVKEMRGDLDGILTQPVVKVEAEASQAPAALPTTARPQRPGGKPYRSPQSVVHHKPAAKSSGTWLVWAAMGVLALGAAYWIFNKSASQSGPLSPLSGTNGPAVTNPPTIPAQRTVRTTLSAADATKDAPFVNSLGMKFVPVPGTNVLFCIHETRHKDYAAYAADKQSVDDSWKNQNTGGFTPTGNKEEHPVMKVSWEDARAFCTWLSNKEGSTYRLPTDKEWSYAVGIGGDEDWKADSTPATVFKNPTAFPWGETWPPLQGSGNYSDESRHAKTLDSNARYLEGYDDSFPTTAPVMSYMPNNLGIYDLGGNVWEWCEDWFDNARKDRVLRGGSWTSPDRDILLSSCRSRYTSETREIKNGFRVVVELPAQASPVAPTPPASPSAAPSPPKPAVVRKRWPSGPNFRSEGRFRAWSSIMNDPKLDLTRLQGVDDAVQVYVNSTGWLVLRRTGDVISNLSGADGLKDIKRVCRGNADDFALITRAGGVIPFPQRTDSTNRIPDGLGPVWDIYISSFRQVAILEDGSLVAWGTAHDGIDTRGNGEWKDKPVLPPGRKAVAMSNTTAAMGLRMDDGKILRWGDNGGFGRAQGKFDADPETPFLMNGMALYGIPKTDGPILIANWRGNDPATPFANDVRGRDFIPANIGGKHVVLLDREGRLVLDPMCPDRSITAALDCVTLAERDLVSVHFSDKSQPATRLLWFDKASSSSPTPSVGTISPTSGSLLAIPDFRIRVANYQKARHTQLAELTTKYRSALTAEKDAATKTGILAALTAADAAIAHAASFGQVIEQNLTATDVKPLPALATVADPAPPRLIELRDIFVREVEKIETTLVASLDQSLATVQTSLTTAMSLDAAKGVESHRQQIKAAFSTTNTRQTSTVVVAAPRPAAAGDWPQWRGPNRDDVSTETGLLKQWPAAGPKRLWVNSGAGLGYSGFAIVGNKLYTMGLYDAEERLICLDASTGTKTWETTVGAIYKNGWGDGPRCTPTVADGMVYALGGNGDLVCADATTGTKIWNTSLTKDLGGKLQSWGYTESPLVDAGLVLITPGGGSGAIAALDAKTGKVTWQTSGVKEAAQYSSIIPLDLNGQRQYAQLLMTTLVGFSGDGQVLWQTPFPGRTAVIPTPIFKDDIVYVAAGYNAGCKAIKLGGTAPVEVYANTNMVNHHGGVILLDDCLYGHSDKGGWTCQDFKTGAIVWQDRGIGKGAVACADGMLYCLGENDGTIALVPASKNGWNMVSSFKLAATSSQRNPKGKIWTHPVISNGKLYLRDQEFISCYDVKN